MIYYGTRSEASDYLASSQWEAAESATQIQALSHASKLIDRLNYLGTQVNQLQEFPRDNDSTVPVAIEHATYLIALALLERDPDSDLENLAVKQSQYGSLKTTYQRASSQEHLSHGIPSPRAWRLLRPFLRDARQFNVERNS